MLDFLKNHPFAVEAFFDSSLVLSYAVPKEQLEHRIPECLTLDTFQDQWAFVAAAMVQTRDLRPKGFPKFLGNDFFLIGFRIFVRYVNRAGKRLRGLYIIRSQTDRKKMEFFGNLFTHYNYSTTDIRQIMEGSTRTILSTQSDFSVTIEQVSEMAQSVRQDQADRTSSRVSPEEEPPLPTHSPFTDWKEARRFAGPLPFTFTYNARDKTVLIIEGVRQNWKPAPVKVLDHHFGFIDGLKLKDAVLANAFEVKQIPYHWKKGKIEKWKQ